LNPRAKQGSSNAYTKFVVKTNTTGSVSPVVASMAMASPISTSPVMASAQFGGEILARPDLASPVPTSRVLATTMLSPLEVQVPSIKEGKKSAPGRADPPSLLEPSPPKVNPTEREGGVPQMSSELDQCQEPKNPQSEARTVTQHTPVDQRGKTKCKYRSKGRSPAKPQVTPTVDEESGGDGTGKEGEGDEVNSSDDDFQTNSPSNKPGTCVKRCLKPDAVNQGPNAPVLDSKKLKKTPVDQRKLAASNTRAARRSSKA
jgi:hypothetical protein